MTFTGINKQNNYHKYFCAKFVYFCPIVQPNINIKYTHKLPEYIEEVLCLNFLIE